MHLRYDEDLIEGLVNLCVSNGRKSVSPLQIRRFQVEREQIYSISDPDDRCAAFSKLYSKWFLEWDLNQDLTRPLTLFPEVTKSIQIFAFRKAKNQSEEGSELFVKSASEKNAVIALCIETFQNTDKMTRLLNHELMHLHDMITPDFGYTPYEFSSNDASRQRLTLQRYRLLWDVTIDGRLTRAGLPTLSDEERRRSEFDSGYKFWPEEKRIEIFQSLWMNPSPRHQALLALAVDPRDTHQQHLPIPGALCPLCSFSTFEWANGPELSIETTEAIRKQFPNWNHEQGVCKRCVEIYEAVHMEQPATMVR
jgi:hypothetical protein